jgi:hypothetical protein
MTFFTSKTEFIVRRAVLSVALTALASMPAFAQEDSHGPISRELWDAVGAAWPERWTTWPRQVSDASALFETPLIRDSERIRVQQLISCNTRHVRWACAMPDEELHIEGPAMRHRVRTKKGRREVVLRIVDYMDSSCFDVQRERLGVKGRIPWGNHKRPVYEVEEKTDGTFLVTTGNPRETVAFTIEADPAEEAGCAFRLKSVSGWRRRM